MHLLYNSYIYNKLVEEQNAILYKKIVSGISLSTIKRIIKEGALNRGVFSTPGKYRKGGKKRVVLDDFDYCAVRNKIIEFYGVRKELPTLRKLVPILKEDINFQGGREALRSILHELGFSFTKCESKRTLLMERHDIIVMRNRYLDRIILNRTADVQKDVIYLDETYIHTTHTVNKCWRSNSVVGSSKPVSTGVRWIIVHAGGVNGFVPNALLIYKSKSMSADYHHDMNAENLKKWLTDKLIPNLHRPSIIVMDNASYHSTQINKPPTQSNTKASIMEWLTANNIHFETDWQKWRLIELVNQHKQPPKYVVDEILKRHGHEVMRLPPYHCTLNPIELIWGIVKQRVAAKNCGSTPRDIKLLAEESFASITNDEWKRCCDHVQREENKFRVWEREGEITQDRFIINTADSDSDGDSYTSVEQPLSPLSGIEWLESFSSSS